MNTPGQNAATIQISPWTIIEVKPGALGQILHSPGDHKWAAEQKYLPSEPVFYVSILHTMRFVSYDFFC